MSGVRWIAYVWALWDESWEMSGVRWVLWDEWCEMTGVRWVVVWWVLREEWCEMNLRWMVWGEWLEMSGMRWMVCVVIWDDMGWLRDDWGMCCVRWLVARWRLCEERCEMNGLRRVVWDELCDVRWVMWDEWCVMSGVRWVLRDEWLCDGCCVTSGLQWMVWDDWWEMTGGRWLVTPATQQLLQEALRTAPATTQPAAAMAATIRAAGCSGASVYCTCHTTATAATIAQQLLPEPLCIAPIGGRRTTGRRGHCGDNPPRLPVRNLCVPRLPRNR